MEQLITNRPPKRMSLPNRMFNSSRMSDLSEPLLSSHNSFHIVTMEWAFWINCPINRPLTKLIQVDRTSTNLSTTVCNWTLQNTLNQVSISWWAKQLTLSGVATTSTSNQTNNSTELAQSSWIIDLASLIQATSFTTTWTLSRFQPRTVITQPLIKIWWWVSTRESQIDNRATRRRLNIKEVIRSNWSKSRQPLTNIDETMVKFTIRISE